MTTNTKSIVTEMAKRFYDVKFAEFGDGTLSDVMEELANSVDEAIRSDVLEPISNVVFGEDTHDEFLKKLPDADEATLGAAKRELMQSITVAAISILVTRLCASQSYSIFGLFAANMVTERNVTDEGVASASEFVHGIINESANDGLDLGLTESKKALLQLEQHFNMATH